MASRLRSLLVVSFISVPVFWIGFKLLLPNQGRLLTGAGQPEIYLDYVLDAGAADRVVLGKPHDVLFHKYVPLFLQNLVTPKLRKLLHIDRVLQAGKVFNVQSNQIAVILRTPDGSTLRTLAAGLRGIRGGSATDLQYSPINGEWAQNASIDNVTRWYSFTFAAPINEDLMMHVYNSDGRSARAIVQFEFKNPAYRVKTEKAKRNDEESQLAR